MVSMFRAVATGEARFKVFLRTKIFTYMCEKLHRHRWTISLKYTWLTMLRTHPKIVGVKGRKGEGLCTRSNVPTHSASLSISPCNTWQGVRSYAPSSHKAKPLCNEAAYTNARTQSHAHAPTRAQDSFFFLQRPCVGMVIEGWQLADRLQTLFFDIKRFSSESHFHAFSLSRSRARAATHAHACTRKHNNARFLWSHCQNWKTLKV